MPCCIRRKFVISVQRLTRRKESDESDQNFMAFIQSLELDQRRSTNDGEMPVKPPTISKLPSSPSSLAELCAKCVGQNIPFEAVQEHHERVPEELQKRIAFWSFPSETRLRRHARMMGVDEHDVELPFQPAPPPRNTRYGRQYRSIDCKDIITNVTQVGMHLTGQVDQNMRRSDYRDSDDESNKAYYSVGVQFDRGCITSAKCSCSSRSDWCVHVVALCLARIRGAVPVDLHPPLGETLSSFSKEQLQKMVHYLIAELPLEGLRPAVKIASQLEDSSSEMNRQNGAPDITSGGSIGDSASWSVDESTLKTNLRKQLAVYTYGRRSDENEITLMCLLEFRGFLHDHDENSAVEIGLVLSILLESSEMCLDKQQPVVTDSRDRRCWSLTAEQRSELCLALSEGLQVFFVDPIISKSCKSAVLKLLSATLIEARSKGSLFLCQVLEAAKTYAQLSPRPSIEYVNSIASRIKQRTFDTQKDVQPANGPTVMEMIYSMSAVLSYCNFHMLLTDYDNDDDKPFLLSAMSDACQSLLLPVFKAHSFKEAAHIQPSLQNVFLPVLMRNALIDNKYFCRGLCFLRPWQEIITLLFGNSSYQLSNAYALKLSTLEYCLAMFKMEESTLLFYWIIYSPQLQDHVISPSLQPLLRDHFKQMPVNVDFTWPWMLLHIAAYDRDMIEDVRKCVQAHISGPDSVLKESQFPPAMMSVLRERFTNLMQHLFAHLPEEASLELFQVLDAAFPSNQICSKEERSTAKKYLRYVPSSSSTSVLPSSNLALPSSLLERNEFRRLDSKYYTVVRDAVLCKLAISSDHISLLNSFLCQDAPKAAPAPIVLLLHVLVCRAFYCHNATLQDCSSFDVPPRVPMSKLDTAAGKYAIQYLHDQWKHCMTPKGLIQLFSCICSDQSSDCSTADAGCKQQLSLLAVDVIGTIAKDKVILQPQSMKVLIKALSAVGNPELLLLLPALIHAKFQTRVGACEIEQVTIALGVMYISSDTASNSDYSDIMPRLKSAFMKELDSLVAQVTKRTHNLHEPSSRRYKVLARQALLTGHTPTSSFDLDVHQWAKIVTAVGCDTLNALLKILEHRRTQSCSPSYQLIADVGIVWTQYQQAVPSQGPGVLEVPAFKAVLEPVLTQKEDQVRKYVEAKKNDEEAIVRAMLLLAALYQPLQLDSNFSSFAFEVMNHVCTREDVKEVVQSRFIATSLSEIIPEQSMEELILIDLQVKQGNASERRIQDYSRSCQLQEAVPPISSTFQDSEDDYDYDYDDWHRYSRNDFDGYSS